MESTSHSDIAASIEENSIQLYLLAAEVGGKTVKREAGLTYVCSKPYWPSFLLQPNFAREGIGERLEELAKQIRSFEIPPYLRFGPLAQPLDLADLLETHGFENVGFKGAEWNPSHTLAGELSGAGYQTEMIGKMHLHPARKRYGFDHIQLAEATRGGQNDYVDWLRRQHGRIEVHPGMAHGVSSNGWVGRPHHLPEEQMHTFWCVDRAMEFLEKRDPSAPFFLNVSFIDPHPPLTPPAPYYERYIHRNLPEPEVGDWAPRFDEPQNADDTRRGRDRFALWNVDPKGGEDLQSIHGDIDSSVHSERLASFARRNYLTVYSCKYCSPSVSYRRCPIPCSASYQEHIFPIFPEK